MKKYVLSFIFALFFIGTNVFAEPYEAVSKKFPKFELYYGAECPHCHDELEWLKGVQKEYPDLAFEKIEVWHDPSHLDQLKERLSEFNQEFKGVPTNIIGEQVIVGFNKEKISKALALEPFQENQTASRWKKYLGYSWPLMSLILGIIDGFNPCAMWTLFMLISLLLAIDDKKKRWLIGSVFLITSGIIYGAALLAYLFGFKAITALLASSIISWAFRGVGILAVVTGIISLIQAKNVGVNCSVRDVESKKKFHNQLKEILIKKNFWFVLLGIIGLAISVNAIELLCSFAIPTTFTTTILSLELPLYKQLVAIGLYDLMYMLDDLIVFIIAMYTLNLKVISPKVTKIMHYLGGFILIILGLLLLIKPSLLALT